MNNVEDLRTEIDGRLISAGTVGEKPVGSIITDSRQVEPGQVFWALRGPNYDGADFVAEAFERGAVGVVAARCDDVPEGCWAVQVADPQSALRQWARRKRCDFTGTMIAVTGSVGRATTRQMIHAVLARRLKGIASPRDRNNHGGVPLSLLQIEPEHDYAVLEFSAGRRGQLAAMAELSAPKVGVITQVGDPRLGGFGSRRNLAEAKAELLAALPSNGRAVLGDDPWLRAMAHLCRAEITWVGTSEQCDLRATDLRSQDGYLRFRVATAVGAAAAAGCEFRVPLWGRHQLTAVLAAVAVGRMCGFEIHEIANALAEFEAVPAMCRVVEVRGATVVNDACHANPTTMRAALEMIRDFDAPGRRIVVFGDMEESGDNANSLHWQLGKQAVGLAGAEMLIACGNYARHVVAGARAVGMPHARAIPCATIEEILPHLGQVVLPGDVVLVKGSRMMAMERVVEGLRVYPQRRSA